MTTDSQGNASFSFAAPSSIPGGSLVTATATGADDGTSEFSEAAPANTAPVISGFKPKGSTRDSTPRIGARVTDGETNLQGSNIEVSLDGKAVTRFSYNPSTDRLSFTSRKLKPGKHTAKIEATDPEGRSATRSSSFRVVAR